MERQDKKTERIFPSELGVWMTCRKKWLFDYMKRKKKLPATTGVKKFPSSPEHLQSPPPNPTEDRV